MSRARPRRLSVSHVITMLELGGAQQNTLYTVAHLDRERFAPALVAGPGGILDAEAERLADVPFTRVATLVREVSPARDLRALAALVALFRRVRPDIVHTHSSKAGILGRLAARLAGVPLVVHSVHGWGFTPNQSPARRALYKGLERLMAPLTERFVAVSEANAREGEEAGIAPRGAFTLIRSGIEIERFARGAASARGALRAELGIGAEVPLVGSVACLKPQKAPLDFVAVAARVAREHPGAHFVLAGDGALRAAVERARAEAGLDARVHLLGWRGDPERVVADLDVFLLTSLHEGLPRVVPEAMAAGRPVVATAVDGTPEAVAEGVTGYLLPAGDVEGLAAAVSRLLANPALRGKLGEAARARVRPWDIDAMVRAQEVLYEELAAGAGLRPRAPAPREDT